MRRIEYQESLLDCQGEARALEWSALNRSIELIRQAQQHRDDASSVVAAIYFTHKLWMSLVEDLGHVDNALPKKMRGQMISIGLWILHELERLRSGQVQDFSDLETVLTAIRDGLQ